MIQDMMRVMQITPAYDPWSGLPVVVVGVAIVVFARDALNALWQLVVRAVENRGWM